MEQLELFGDFGLRERAVKMAKICIERGHNGFRSMRDDGSLIQHLIRCFKPYPEADIIYFQVSERNGYIRELPQGATCDIFFDDPADAIECADQAERQV